ncbi:MAG TPA: hypothetical protein VFU47_13070 [Armatimonadota bacterium]|nr:hypothetical protein [Armatimonadota bacterium]
MADRGPNSDFMFLHPERACEQGEGLTYEDASYLGTDPQDEEEVQDLGFIVEDHDDRRISMLDGWQRLNDLDTNEPLETNRSGPIPHEVSLRARGPSPERFATDYHIDHADGEEQEADFISTSMLATDPDMEAGEEDFTDDTMHGIHGENLATDIAGNVVGPADGLGTTVPQDLGSDGFQVLENPLASGPEMDLLRGELSDYDEVDTDPTDDVPVDLLASPPAGPQGEECP